MREGSCYKGSIQIPNCEDIIIHKSYLEVLFSFLLFFRQPALEV